VRLFFFLGPDASAYDSQLFFLITVN